MAKITDPIRCSNQDCLTVFVPRRPWQQFCSSECKNTFWNARREERLPTDRIVKSARLHLGRLDRKLAILEKRGM